MVLSSGVLPTAPQSATPAESRWRAWLPVEAAGVNLQQVLRLQHSLE